MLLRLFVRTTGGSLSTVSAFYLRYQSRSSLRCAEVWGDDAHVFDPRRYLNREKKEGVPTIGVYGDVLTFGLSVSSICRCLGAHVVAFPFSNWCACMHRLEILVSPNI